MSQPLPGCPHSPHAHICVRCYRKMLSNHQADIARLTREANNAMTFPRRRSKYNNRRVVLDGYTFDSQKERDRYCVLKTAQDRGEIQNLCVHQDYALRVNQQGVGRYVADFVYTRQGVVIVEDVKGIKTAVYRLKKKLMKAIHDIEIVEV